MCSNPLSSNTALKLIETYKQTVRSISVQMTHLLDQNEELYQSKINLCLQKLKNADLNLLKQNSLICRNQLLLTRHGKCRLWAEKKLGLNPNSALAQQSIEAMKQTSKYTEGFLHFPQKVPTVLISPMIRAKQTAKLVLPERKKYKIRLEISLTENSNKPSSTYLASHQHFNRICTQLSICQNPRKTINFRLSSLLYDREMFEASKTISNEVDQQLLIKSITEKKEMEQKIQHRKTYYSTLDSITHEEITNLNEQEKIKNLKDLLETLNKEHFYQDFWFFGHSKNIKLFLYKMLGKKQLPKFAETIRLLICVKQTIQEGITNEHFYFHPGYTLIVCQQTGRIVCSEKFDYFSLIKAL